MGPHDVQILAAIPENTASGASTQPNTSSALGEDNWSWWCYIVDEYVSAS